MDADGQCVSSDLATRVSEDVGGAGIGDGSPTGGMSGESAGDGSGGVDGGARFEAVGEGLEASDAQGKTCSTPA